MSEDVEVRYVVPLLLVALAGCVTRVPMSDAYDGPDALPAEISGEVPDDPFDPLVVQADDELRDRIHFNLRRVTLPSNVDAESSIGFDYYDVDGSQRTPVIVLLPIFNGQPIVTRYFARYFANQGWAAVVIDRGRDPLSGVDDPDSLIRANLAEYRRVLDWIEQQPELDRGRIGLFGISFGAMDAVMLSAIDGRIDALVAAMAGGDLAYLMLNTNYRRVARMVDGMLEDSGMTRDVLYDVLEQRIPTDPLSLAPYVDAERVLLIMTKADVIVPFEAQEKLRESLGAPETLYLPTGHRSSIVFFPKVRSSAFEFFSRRFEQDRLAIAAN
jgi:pimeloyl-ACP methyl ester carboxylesterase